VATIEPLAPETVTKPPIESERFVTPIVTTCATLSCTTVNVPPTDWPSTVRLAVPVIRKPGAIAPCVTEVVLICTVSWLSNATFGMSTTTAAEKLPKMPAERSVIEPVALTTRTYFVVPSPSPIAPFANETVTTGALGVLVSRWNVTSPVNVNPPSFSERLVPATRTYAAAVSNCTLIAPLNTTPGTFWIVATAAIDPDIDVAVRTK